MQSDSFFHPRVTKNFLKDHHFRYSRGWSEDSSEAYILTLPIYKYHSMSLLELRIVLYDDGIARIDVFDSASRGVYAPWYRQESYERYPILKTIDNNIERLMANMGFQKRGENERRKSSKAQHQPRRSRRLQEKA